MKIAIAGNYGAKNLGDEIILEGLIKTLRDIDPKIDITVLSADPLDTEERHSVKAVKKFPSGIRSFYNYIFKYGRQTKKAVKSCDFFVLGGGGLFSNLTLKAYFIWGIQALMALRYGRKIIMYGQSVGPFNGRIQRIIVKKLFRKAVFIAVRDLDSKEVLKKMGIRGKINLIPDLIFCTDLPEGRTDKAKGKNIIISLRYIKGLEDGFKKTFMNFSNWLIEEQNYELKFVNFQSPEDERLTEEIIDGVKHKEKVSILPRFKHSEELFETFADAEYIIGMRLHSILTAIKCEKPFMAINYAPKVSNFLEYAKIKDVDMKISSVTFKNLKEKFIELTGEKKKIEEKIHDFNERADKRNKEIIKDLKSFFQNA